MAFYFSDTINDVLSVALESGQSREFTGEIDCYSGHELSGEAVADTVIEAKVAGGSYVAIETTPIDLTAYDGTRQALTVKITAGVITTPLTHAFRLRKGPA